MCRHLAYLGPPKSLQALLLDPPHSLCTQAYAPRRQEHGCVNVDGFGAGWYVNGRAEPVRYRRSVSMWSDQSFTSIAPTVESGCVLSAVRSATPGFPSEESGAAPFTHGRWLFSHNGVLSDFRLAHKGLREASAWTPDALAPVDSALLFGLAVAHWEAGASVAEGLARVVAQVAELGGGRLNLLACDGRSLAATTYGDTLFVHEADGVVLASEPYDDALGWRPVPPRSLVEVGESGTKITTL